jgi:putative membrane protein
MSIPGEASVLASALLLGVAADLWPAAMPVFGPWDFSWATFILIGFTLVWLRRGLRAGVSLPRPRLAAALAGLGIIYAVSLTHFDYGAQHMFMLNRLQHGMLHHAGPFLLALAWPVEAIAAGMPPWLLRLCRHPDLAASFRWTQHPLVAVLLFEGLLYFWLVPPVTFRAMLDPRLYAVMNLSMLVDGLMFWFLVLDPRPKPACRIGFFSRLCMAFLIIFPQIAIGTILGLIRVDIYPSFALCGRLWPAISPLADQQIGGLILWIPAGMMSSIASVIIMARMFRHEDNLVAVPT